MKAQQTAHSKCEATIDLSAPIPAERLLAQRDKVQIVFKDQIYTLSLTRNDKLILTK